MLVVSRKANESLAVDWLGRPELGTVTLTVLAISGSRVGAHLRALAGDQV
jgi:sRNA-binding carbon storage regulator CsrA